MNRVNVLLLFALMISTITPSFGASSSTQRLTELKKSVTKNVNQFIKCVKGDKECSQTAKITARAILTLLAALTLAAAGKLGFYLFNKQSLAVKKAQRALFTATKRKDIAGVNEALRAGAQVNIADSNSYEDTPLTYAVDTEIPNIDIINLLIKQGADVNQSDKGGLTPLSIAAANNDDTSAIAILLKAGANVNAIPHTGNTALHKAANYGRYDHALKLLNAGAKVNAQNIDGETPLDLAITEKMKELLIKYGAKTSDQIAATL